MSEIGKIVKSNSHIDYVCQIYGPGEMSPEPEANLYAFGSFAAIELADGGELIGVVYNTQLVNPDFGTFGPRLSNREELQVFSPDYLMETATLVGLLTVGMIDRDGGVTQGVPALAGEVNAEVRALDADEFNRFHLAGGERLCLRYVPLLIAQESPLISPLLLTLLARLGELYPAEQARLTVMRNNLAWRRSVAPIG